MELYANNALPRKNKAYSSSRLADPGRHFEPPPPPSSAIPRPAISELRRATRCEEVTWRCRPRGRAGGVDCARPAPGVRCPGYEAAQHRLHHDRRVAPVGRMVSSPPPLCRSFLFLFLSPTQQEPLQSSPPPFPCLPRRKTGRAHRRGHERRPETRPCLSLLSSLERERGGGGWGGNAAQRRSRLGPRLALYINLTKQRERGIGGFVFTRKVKRVSERRRKEVRYMDPRKGGKER